jgi:hypothetical protein
LSPPLHFKAQPDDYKALWGSDLKALYEFFLEGGAYSDEASREAG